MTRKELAADQAHVWVVRPGKVLRRTLVSRYEQLLTPEERTRRTRFRSESGRLEYVVTRVLVRTTLSHYTGVAPGEWRFGARPGGRPEVVRPMLSTTPRFSLSHSRGLVVCAVVRDRDIGVDVENTTRGVGFRRIAERYFAPGEVADIRSLPEGAARKRFFEYWTLKESAIKALGSRIASGLSRYAFDLGSDTIRAAFEFEDPGGWRFFLRDVGPDHLLAASVRTEKPLRLDVRETVPLA